MKMKKVKVGPYQMFIRDNHAREWDRNTSIVVIQEDEYAIEPFKKYPGINDVRVILDIGACIGAFSLLCANTFKNARIVAVEPDPENFELLVKNVGHFPNVETHNVALVPDEYPDTVLMRRHRFNSGATRLVGLSEKSPSKDWTEFQCAGAAVSDFCNLNRIDAIDLLKIDCEGAELLILPELQKLGLTGTVKWLRGEWHGKESIKAFKSAFKDTHKIIILDSGPNGRVMGHKCQ